MGETELLPAPRACSNCNGSLEGKRPHAVYCSRKCKAAATERRRPPRDNAARYVKERDKRLAWARDYQRKNPDVPQRAKRKRKARMAGSGILHISKRDWLRLVNRHQGKCFYCQEVRVMTMDHVIPISRGGRHSIGNIVPACKRCNSSKRARTIMEWRLSDRTVAPAATYGRPNLGEEPGRQLASA